MSVPKKKLSKRRVRARRSHHGVSTVHSMKSPIPGDESYIRPHQAHEYNGKLYSWKELKKLMGGLKKRAALKGAKEEAPATEEVVEETPKEETAEKAAETTEEKKEESAK